MITRRKFLGRSALLGALGLLGLSVETASAAGKARKARRNKANGVAARSGSKARRRRRVVKFTEFHVQVGSPFCPSDAICFLDAQTP